MSKIKNIRAMEIIDSRGNPTVWAQVTTDDGYTGEAAVPSGASTGAFEACELRDGEKTRFLGKGVTRAVENVNTKIFKLLESKDVTDQNNIDNIMIASDGTDNKTNFGANAMLAVSLACARASAAVKKQPLYASMGDGVTLPVPMMNILNGGAHASNNVDVQEFMIMPVGAPTFKEGLRYCVEVFHTLKGILQKQGLSTAVGDEGGFAPNLSSDEEAIKVILDAIDKAGFKAGGDFYIAIDAATTEWYKDGEYYLPKNKQTLTRSELLSHWRSLVKEYPIISLEDPFGEEDWDSFREFTSANNSKLQIVGDDLFVTNPKRLLKGIEINAANAILIKLNQIGTLTETLDAINIAKAANYNCIISHRSGETEDTFIADLAVAVNAGQIKTGAPSRSERVAKYNRLLMIEQELGARAVYYGTQILKR
ncbi:MAG: phosphopyruvate hydratase [Clostridiales bacterium GWF2_36_10]|nr:MAG: phosphopyruvate hydratase [Clostridiales bacterium GWF2_36_10]HAN20938.1 phosphopyruvate hydratase [Clostridiales bacterium]